MKWLKAMLLKMFRGALEEIVQGALEKAVLELNEEIDSRFEDEEQRNALRSGVAMLRQRVALAIRERI